MGISVSVDSWAEQTIQELTEKHFELGDPEYVRLIESASNTSEIFLIDSEIIRQFVYSDKGNLNNTLKKCLENLISPEQQIRLNAATFLSRFLPFMIKKESPSDLLSYMLTPTDIFDSKSCPGEYIITTSIKLLSSTSLDDPDNLVSAVNLNIEVYDLLVFTVFSLLKFFNNPTLYHQLLIQCEKVGQQLISVLFNYIHFGGRKTSVVSILGMLLFHPSDDFAEASASFLKSGGMLSSNLCRDTGDDGDMVCFLTSLAIREDKTKIAFSKISNPNLLRLALVKELMNGKPHSILPNELIHAYEKTNHSLICEALCNEISEKPESLIAAVPPLDDYSFTEPKAAPWFVKWVSTTIPELFIFAKSLWFIGTNCKIELPDLSVVDQLITIKAL